MDGCDVCVGGVGWNLRAEHQIHTSHLRAWLCIALDPCQRCKDVVERRGRFEVLLVNIAWAPKVTYDGSFE